MKKISIFRNQDITWIKKIKLYKDIFWESPWEEWFICKNCKWIYSKVFMSSCNCWDSILVPFYKNEELRKVFNDLSLKQNFQELVACILDNNVWFISWWNSSIEDLNKDKLLLNWDQFKDLSINILKIIEDFDLEDFYYFAEIWIKKDFRWNDIAWSLYRENLDRLKQRWEKYILVRTTRKSDLPYKWLVREWYKEVFLYNDEQDRVILVYKI
jgi:hypothetical protein